MTKRISAVLCAAPGVFLLLMPLLLQAQISFEPRRIDDSTSRLYYFPVIERNQSGLFTTWAEAIDTFLEADGRVIDLNGNPLGDPILYETATTSEFTCPANITIVPGEDGSEARLIFHS